MSNFTTLETVDLTHVTGGGIDDPSAPTLSDLRSSSKGFDIGPPSRNIGSAPVFKPLVPFKIGK